MSAIYWERYPRYSSFLLDSVREEFNILFTGTYTQRTLLSHDLVSLQNRLTQLPTQELDIFLSLKGISTHVPTAVDVNFTELLLHSLEHTSPEAKRVILFALKYIVTNNENSRAFIIEKSQLLERIANSNGNLVELAKEVLQIANDNFCIPIKPNYQFSDGEQFQYHVTAKKIFERASGSLMFIDNYANDEILNYINNYCDCDSINDIQIVCNDQIPNSKSAERRIKPLKHAILYFSKEYKNINIEARSSSKVHDRYIITDKEVWNMGTSLKDGGNKVCTMSQLKDNAESETRTMFREIWDESIPI
jgi:hypothetical protein